MLGLTLYVLGGAIWLGWCLTKWLIEPSKTPWLYDLAWVVVSTLLWPIMVLWLVLAVSSAAWSRRFY